MYTRAMGHEGAEAVVDPQTVTRLLHDWRAGDSGAGEQLVPLIYTELKQIARRFLRRERDGHTFSPTDLVSEAYLRLSVGAQPAWADRVHFFAIAARTMRQVLVDHARARLAHKRDGGPRVPLDDQLAAFARPEAMVELDDALRALAARDERKARVIELHYFAGLTHEEIADVLAIHANTVSRDLKLGQAWIFKRMQDPTAAL